MGLDMFLEREYYIFSTADIAEKDLHITLNGYPQNGNDIIYSIPLKNLKKVVLEEMYWRKANAIHKWFVDNVQDGHDDCGRYFVPTDKLYTLRETLQKVMDISADNLTQEELEEQCKQLLPTQEGFFFGDTSYKEVYFGDVAETLTMLDTLLADIEKGAHHNYQIYYSSSW